PIVPWPFAAERRRAASRSSVMVGDTRPPREPIVERSRRAGALRALRQWAAGASQRVDPARDLDHAGEAGALEHAGGDAAAIAAGAHHQPLAVAIEVLKTRRQL